MSDSGFWFAVTATVIACAGLVFNLFNNKNGAEIGFLKTRVASLESDINAMRLVNERQRQHIDECEGKTRDLEQQVMSLMRELISQGRIPPRPAPHDQT